MKEMVTAYDIFYSGGALVLWDLEHSFFFSLRIQAHTPVRSYSRDSPKLSAARFHSVCVGPFSKYLAVWMPTWNLLCSRSHRKIDFMKPNIRPMTYYTFNDLEGQMCGCQRNDGLSQVQRRFRLIVMLCLMTPDIKPNILDNSNKY